MTPKEKAQEILEIFHNQEHLVGYLSTKECKLYASLVAEEVLDEIGLR